MSVLDTLRSAIVTGRIAPGARMVQEELAARYGVSRIPLREALRTLEHTATRIAAERRVDLREPTALKRRQAESAIERGDLRALIDLDAEFHRSIAVGTQNAHIVRALASYWPLIMRAMHVYLSIERYRSEVWQEHTAIANAIAAGDVELAVVSMDAHILASRAKLLEEFSR